jgi:hypothetical protein
VSDLATSVASTNSPDSDLRIGTVVAASSAGVDVSVGGGIISSPGFVIPVAQVGDTVVLLRTAATWAILGKVAAQSAVPPDNSWVDFPFNAATSWTSSGVAPVLNDGTYSSRYIVRGKTVTWAAQIIMGAATTFGTGTYSFGAPIATISGGTGLYIGAAVLIDSDTTANRRCATTLFNGTQSIIMYHPAGLLTPTSPFTFAVNDSIQWTVTYEVPNTASTVI